MIFITMTKCISRAPSSIHVISTSSRLKNINPNVPKCFTQSIQAGLERNQPKLLHSHVERSSTTFLKFKTFVNHKQYEVNAKSETLYGDLILPKLAYHPKHLQSQCLNPFQHFLPRPQLTEMSDSKPVLQWLIE